jgi:hypothetical protein
MAPSDLTEDERSIPFEVSDTSTIENGLGIKRRKLRKGTSSCWACKKRKVKCVFSKLSDTLCISCRQRGSECVTQEFPEVSLDATRQQMGDRIVRVEALLDQLVKSSTTTSESFPASSISNLTVNPQSTPPTVSGDSESTLCQSQSDCSPVSLLSSFNPSVVR